MRQRGDHNHITVTMVTAFHTYTLSTYMYTYTRAYNLLTQLCVGTILLWLGLLITQLPATSVIYLVSYYTLDSCRWIIKRTNLLLVKAVTAIDLWSPLNFSELALSPHLEHLHVCMYVAMGLFKPEVTGALGLLSRTSANFCTQTCYGEVGWSDVTYRKSQGNLPISMWSMATFTHNSWNRKC